MNIFKKLVSLWIWLFFVVFAPKASFAYDYQCGGSKSYDDAIKTISGYDRAAVFATNERGCNSVGTRTPFINFFNFLAAETIDSAAVRFSQSSISRNFSGGGTIDDLAAGLRSGSVKAGDIPPIRLVEQDGNLFSLDNRRLWSFKQAEVPVPYRMATPEEAAAEAWKFTTKNGGTSIRVRGQ